MCRVISARILFVVFLVSVEQRVYLFIYIRAAHLDTPDESGSRQLAWTLDFRVDFSDGVLLLRQEPDAVWRAAARSKH